MSFCRSRDAFATVAFPPARGTGTQGLSWAMVRGSLGHWRAGSRCKRFANVSRLAANVLQPTSTQTPPNGGEAARAIPSVFGAFGPCSLGFAGFSSIGAPE